MSMSLLTGEFTVQRLETIFLVAPWDVLDYKLERLMVVEFRLVSPFPF